MNEDRLRKLANSGVPFTSTEARKAAGLPDTSTSSRRLRRLLAEWGLVPTRAGRQFTWAVPDRPAEPVVHPSGTVDPEAAEPDWKALYERTLEEREDAVQWGRERANENVLLRDFAIRMAERWASALGAAGYIPAVDVPMRSSAEIERLNAGLAATRLQPQTVRREAAAGRDGALAPGPRLN